MDRQLFSHAVRVSRRRSGAVPVSLALHGIVIGGGVLASIAMMPPLPVVEGATPKIPVVLVPPEPMRAVPTPPPPPKGTATRATPRRTTQTVRPPTQMPPPVAPASDLSNVVDVRELVDGPAVDFSAGPGTGVGAECIVGCVEGPVGDPSGEAGGEGPRRVHMGIDAPARIHFVKPTYPRVAIMAGVQGEVVVDCVIGPDGKVYEAKILSGNPLLQQAALDAVRQWRYSRPRLNDTPISVLLTVTVKFGLQR